MTDHDGSLTDRWMGVFRSVGREPIGEARYARVRAHQRRSVIQVAFGLAFTVGPAVATGVAVALESELLVSLAFISWIIGPIFGVGVLHTGLKRVRHLRGVHADSEVEVFAGVAPPLSFSNQPGPLIDRTTVRLLNAVVILSGHNHRIVIHPETGLLLEVDGKLVEEFVGGDVSITARRPRAHAEDHTATKRPLSVFEKHELRLLARRLTRGTWGLVLGVASGIAAVVALAWTITSTRGPDVDVVITVAIVCGGLLLVSAADAWVRRKLRAKLQRDAEAGLRRADDRWLLPESGITWEANGIPGPLRLAKGGLGSEADGRTRPVMF